MSMQMDFNAYNLFEFLFINCEMIKKKISKRKNTERDIDILIKNFIFLRLDNIMDRHL